MCKNNNNNDATCQVENLVSARGMTISGRTRLLIDSSRTSDHPLVIMVHGGTYTSAYFDVPGYSLLDLTARLGIPAIAIDRPGYGFSTAFEPNDANVMNNADLLDEIIGKLWQSYGDQAKGVVLIGHSIGAAVVTTIAARQPAWPLLGIAISGCLLNTPSALHDTWTSLPDVPMIDLDYGLKDGVMFGPEWTYDHKMPMASRVADALIPRNELIDIAIDWPGKLEAVASQVRVPVHHRQGEYDPLWVTNKDEVEAFAKAFSSAPEIDTKLFAHAGHCIDFHRLGNAFQLEQLSFALRCCVQGRP